MKTRKIKGVLVDTENNEIKEFDLDYDGNLDNIYRLLKCELIEIPSRVFGGNKLLDIICDEEALLHNTLPPLAVLTFDENHNKIIETIHGNVFVCNHNNQGNLKSLTKDEVDLVLNNTCYVYDKSINAYRHCLRCEV